MNNGLHFEWDENKSARNRVKHQVSFEEARSVFEDPMFIMLIDDEHSLDEERFITIGISDQGRVLMVAHADRDGQIRIISARRATKQEEQYYATTD